MLRFPACAKLCPSLAGVHGSHPYSENLQALAVDSKWQSRLQAALPALTESNTLPESDFVAPHTLVEQRLAALLVPLLHVERVSAKDNFFLLGGHSLLGTQLITKIKEAFDVELSLLSLFDHPTLEEMSLEIENLILAKIARWEWATGTPSYMQNAESQ